VIDARLGYCKLCELEDFRHPDLRELIRETAGAGPDRPDYPDGTEHRKAWEVAMTARALRDFGALRADAEILGVGAGHEATIFWLTRYVRRVFATDLYLEDDSWSATDSEAQMLVSPEQLTSLEWNLRRLVVQHMDARNLRYEDESFDGIFSSGSIEHFGTLDEIRVSVEEMHRVLRPGGVAALATEYRLAGSSGIPGTHLFDEAELRSVLLDGLSWELSSPLDLSLSETTLKDEIDFGALTRESAGSRAAAIAERLRGLVRGHQQDPDPDYPHIVLTLGEHSWTSVHLTLIKGRQ
jgi:SAM-dependent methyltransferase